MKTIQKNAMKTQIKTSVVLMALTLIGLISCENNERYHLSDIAGLYEGTFTIYGSLKSASPDGSESEHGTAVVSMMEGNQIEVHCYGEAMDTTIVLDYYQHNDSVMVCLSGDDFERFYGHMQGHGHMGGSMMDDINDGETAWMHHLNDEHTESDKHFGGFNMQEMTFTYSFHMTDGVAPYYMNFHGVKQ